MPTRFVTSDASTWARAPPRPPSRDPSPPPAPAARDAREAHPGVNLQPVFRVSPYRAEAARQRAGGTTARLLFVDEGNQCRCAGR